MSCTKENADASTSCEEETKQKAAKMKENKKQQQQQQKRQQQQQEGNRQTNSKQYFRIPGVQSAKHIWQIRRKLVRRAARRIQAHAWEKAASQGGVAGKTRGPFAIITRSSSPNFALANYCKIIKWSRLQSTELSVLNCQYGGGFN